MDSQHRLAPHRLTPAAWIALAGAVAGAIAFGWFVSQIPFSTMGTGSVAGMVFGVVITAAMFFAPQVLIVFLFDSKNPGLRTVGVVLGAMAAIAGIAILATWAGGAQFEGGQAHDPKALGLWLPLIVMGVIDGVAAVITWIALRRDRMRPRRPVLTT